MDQFTLIGIGEILWDEFPEFKSLGGAPANFAIHTKHLGANGIIISSIGRDEPGEEIIKCILSYFSFSLLSNICKREAVDR